MKRTYKNTVVPTLAATLLVASLAGCGTPSRQSTAKVAEAEVVQEEVQAEAEAEDKLVEASAEESTGSTPTVQTASLDAMVEGGALDTASLFTDRDLEQEADLGEAVRLDVESGQDILITDGGTYVLSGTAENATVTVDVDSAQKVQLVLDGVSITNVDRPAICVVSADKVFVTTVEGSDNVLSTTGAFVADGDTNADAVIFSKEDLVLNGLGTLTISSAENGISCKDDLKVTGGTYVITCEADALEAHDSIRIADGTFAISTAKDGLHAEDDEDDSVGFVYVCGGMLDIVAEGDGIQATTVLQVDGGTVKVSASEAFEATYVQINGGSIDLTASDDGINASWKSQSVGNPTIDIRGGELSITMGQGDTDALDSNGYLYVSGGTIDITAQFAFDFEYGSEFTGGTIYVNGEQVSEITESMMMGGPGGGLGGPAMGQQPSGGPGGGW